MRSPAAAALALITALMLLLSPSPAAAKDGRPITIGLTGGTTVTGTLVEQQPTGFVVRTGSGERLYLFSELESVEIGERPAPPPVEAAAAGLWCVARMNDGTMVSGMLVEQTPETIVIQAGAELLTLASSDVAQLVMGDLGGGSAKSAASTPSPAPRTAPPARPPPGWNASTPLAPAAGPNWGSWPGWTAYRVERLRLVDHRGQLIGPPEAGYPTRLFTRENRKRFHAVLGDDIDLPLSLPDFVQLADDAGLTERFNAQMLLMHRERGTGITLLVAGASMLTSAIIIAAAANNNGNFAASTPAIGLGHGGGLQLAIGIAVAIAAEKRSQELMGERISEAFERDEAWGGVQGHNGALRRKHGLPEDQRADGPE